MSGAGHDDWRTASGWWRQSIAVSRVWETVTSRPELWLGEGASVTFVKGAQYEVSPADGAPGASGEIGW